MRLLSHLASLAFVIAIQCRSAAAQWSFSDAIISVSSKAGDGFKDKLSSKSFISQPITLAPSNSVKVLLTATKNSEPARPHQAFLTLHDPNSGLGISLPFGVKATGKAQLEFSQKDIPLQLLIKSSALRATLLIGSFGSSMPLSSEVFDLALIQDANTPSPTYQKPLRYGQLDEIHHVFKPQPQSPPEVVSIVFSLAVLGALLLLLGAWKYLGANLAHCDKALSKAPIPVVLYYTSILVMEGVFFMYYYSWNLFKTLPIAGIVGLVTLVSGSKALSEVQGRRLAGQR